MTERGIFSKMCSLCSHLKYICCKFLCWVTTNW